MDKLLDLALQANKGEEVIKKEMNQYLQDEIASFQEATALLGVTRTPLYNYIQRDLLTPFINRERVQLFLKSDVEVFKTVVEQNKKRKKHQG